ncbi:MAG TPA: trypsin-like peptidase domain-containing protein [Chloroflexota bacterium]|nr:trypsin-like peptidase domain-containing protein [Chloroflexota bacterium]
MASLLRTATVAVVSSATTAALFLACTVDNPARQAQPSPTAATGPAGPSGPGLGGGSPSAGGGGSPSAARSPAPPVAAAQSAQPVAPAGANPATQVYQQNGASVVNITSLAVVRTRLGQAEQPQGIGSGFVIDDQGRIVTNNHVVQDADQLAVTFQDKTTVPATLLGRDPDNDLAVIQVDPNAADDQGGQVRTRLKAVTLGDSDSVTIGETAIAMGSPLGLAQTVTEGIVSARRNPGEESQVPNQQLDLLGGAIQTDAAINPGNSGGPLFNAAGQVIGVDSAILSQSGGNEGIGFAIPINVVKRVAPELIQTGRYRHPQVGVTSLPLADLSPQTKQQLGLPANQRGLLVQQVTAGAQQAGIQPGNRRLNLGNDTVVSGGDIISAVDGQPTATGGDLRGYIENTKHPGDSVTLTVLRNGQRLDVPVTLSERPAQQQQQPLLPFRR